MIYETETELLLTPTAALKDNVNALTDEVYSFLLGHFYVVVILVAVLIVLLLVTKTKIFIVRKRAKKNLPDSTNDWFSWEDFYKWQKEEKR